VKIPGLRWIVVGLLCLVTAINYLDRQTLALLSGTLGRLWGLTTVQYSYVTAAWLISYTVMSAVGGRLVDVLGVRRGFSLFVSLWAAADALHALARTFIELAFCRAFLGASEAANFPAGLKAVSEWFPVRERALAVGILNAGTALGAAVAAPLVAWITLHLGWRYAFLCGAVLSLAWLAAWLALYRSPRAHPRITGGELALIEEGRPPTGPAPQVPLRTILSRREVWGCIAARVLTDPLSYLFAFWIPRFLEQERSFDLAAIGRLYWMPYVGLALGNLAGGLIPARLMAAGWSLDRSRKTVMFAASCATGACFLLLTRVAGAGMTIGLLAGAMFCHAAWANMTLPTEVFPQGIVGSVAGCAAGISSLVATVTTLAIGQTVSIGSFTPIFLVYAVLPMTGFAAVCLLIKDLGRIREFPGPAAPST
jgi:ACS family hexuronate transporter-like MFS transporter